MHMWLDQNTSLTSLLGFKMEIYINGILLQLGSSLGEAWAGFVLEEGALCLLGLCSWAQLLILARQLQCWWLKKVRFCGGFSWGFWFGLFGFFFGT